jgi:hypothetical protein
MNLFDNMSEELTLMMIELDNYADQGLVEDLVVALEGAHCRACEASQQLRTKAR